MRPEWKTLSETQPFFPSISLVFFPSLSWEMISFTRSRFSKGVFHTCVLIRMHVAHSHSCRCVSAENACGRPSAGAASARASSGLAAFRSTSPGLTTTNRFCALVSEPLDAAAANCAARRTQAGSSSSFGDAPRGGGHCSPDGPARDSGMASWMIIGRRYCAPRRCSWKNSAAGGFRKSCSSVNGAAAAAASAREAEPYSGARFLRRQRCTCGQAARVNSGRHRHRHRQRERYDYCLPYGRFRASEAQPAGWADMQQRAVQKGLAHAYECRRKRASHVRRVTGVPAAA